LLNVDDSHDQVVQDMDEEDQESEECIPLKSSVACKKSFERISSFNEELEEEEFGGIIKSGAAK
jgi:hypothetical protein